MVDRGILVNLIEKGTWTVLMPERIASRQSRCFHGPMRKKIIFLNFWGSACKLRMDKKWNLQL